MQLNAQQIQCLRCPICGQPMTAQAQQIACANRHSYDVARQGYINFLTRPVDAHYDAALFAARAHICRLGLFDALLDAITARIAAQGAAQPVHMIDVGCGEGSHLAAIAAQLAAQGVQTACMGIDLAKDGIRLAARQRPGMLWCVADMTRMPCVDQACDVLLDILSPIQYAEAARVLRTGGLLLKAVPGPDYLRELREAFADDAPDYANDHTVSHFAERFGIHEQLSVRSQLTVPQAHIADLIRMTPLGWRAPEEAVRALTARESLTVTADFALLIGQKH